MPNPALLAKAAALLLKNEDARKGVGWAVVAVLSPVILVIALVCALAAGTASHNVSAVQLCFNEEAIPASFPAEYRGYIEEMRRSFTLLDGAITDINSETEEEESLDDIRIKAIFYALYFGEDAPSRRAHRQFVDCFVTYEERTRTVENEEGEEGETSEETYTVAVPIQDMEQVCQRISQTMGVEITEEQKSNANSIYILIRYGWSNGGAGWDGVLEGPVLSVDGFCSPLGANWRQMVSSNFGPRYCRYHGQELHSGLDMASPAGTPIRAALGGVVIRSEYNRSYGNYTMIDHGNGLTTAYAHQSQRLVSIGDRIETGQVIGLVGSTGNSTGPHLHLEVRVNGQLQDPKYYLP